MNKYEFVIKSHTTPKNGCYQIYHDFIDFWGWYPSRQSAIIAAMYYNNQHREFGLYIEKIWECDYETDKATASIDFAKYATEKGTWLWPTECNYVWDEE